MISKEEVEGLAELARLKLSEEETTSLQKDISNILEYVETISNVEMPQDSDLRRGQLLTATHNILRDDTAREQGNLLADTRENLLKALPKREGDYNVVRKIIQKDE